MSKVPQTKRRIPLMSDAYSLQNTLQEVNLKSSILPEKSKLDSALDLAARGFRVFPLVENGKLPLFEGWPDKATTNPEQIRKWWTDEEFHLELNYNIGICTNDLIVVDIDVKSEKRGLESFEGLGLSFDSFTVATPTGGRHVFYWGPLCANTVEILGPGSGLDIRGWHGFVVGAGSVINGRAYEILRDTDVGPVPDILTPFLRPPGRRARGENEFAEDSEGACAEALHYLTHNAPVAVKGSGGNTTAYKVAAHLTRDLGLSADTALALMMSNWAERCIPPAGRRRSSGRSSITAPLMA
ncbi:hypothetical protein CU048_12125 [Beijerinckiaceae bacterium]|nr:hypothetical protein CU048_12125 [Beijerinckiaceae bacterium]